MKNNLPEKLERKPLMAGSEVTIINFQGQEEKVRITADLVRQFDIGMSGAIKAVADMTRGEIGLAISIYLLHGMEDMRGGDHKSAKFKNQKEIYCRLISYPWAVGGFKTWNEMAKAFNWSERQLRYYVYLGKFFCTRLKITYDNFIVPEIPEALRGYGLVKLIKFVRFADVIDSMRRQGYATLPNGKKLNIIDASENRCHELNQLMDLFEENNKALPPPGPAHRSSERYQPGPDDPLALLDGELPNPRDAKYKNDPGGWKYWGDLIDAINANSKGDVKGDYEILQDLQPEILATLDEQVAGGVRFLSIVMKAVEKKLNGAIATLFTAMRSCPDEHMKAVPEWQPLRAKIDVVHQQVNILLYSISEISMGNRQIWDAIKQIDPDNALGTDAAWPGVRKYFMKAFSEGLLEQIKNLPSSSQSPEKKKKTIRGR